jgi:osmotically-inducible protein OsmY
MRVVSAAVSFAVCIGFIVTTAAAQQKPAGRYDQILQDVNKYPQSKKEFQGIKAVEDQIVTLEGAVNVYIDRENLEEKVKKMKNVDGISSMFDDQLRVRLYRAIYGAPTLRRYEMDPQKLIRIVVENGHVTLYGVVDGAMDKQIAGTQANGVPGVFSVDNQLVALSEIKK